MTLLKLVQLKQKTSLQIEGEMKTDCRVSATGLQKNKPKTFYFVKKPI